MIVSNCIRARFRGAERVRAGNSDLLVLSSDDLPKPKGTELLQKGVETVQEYSPDEEREESRRWRVFRIGEQEHRVDMKAIEPYKRVISHGGNIPAGERASSVSIFHKRPT